MKEISIKELKERASILYNDVHKLKHEIEKSNQQREEFMKEHEEFKKRFEEFKQYFDKVEGSFTFTVKTRPSCETCEVFLKTKLHTDRALMCETARAVGACPKDEWFEGFKKELGEVVKEHGDVKCFLLEVLKEILEK